MQANTDAFAWPGFAAKAQAAKGGQIGISDAELSGMIGVSALPWVKATAMMQLPSNANGLRILDVGGGASDVTATLVEMGADASSVDPCYAKGTQIADSIRTEILAGRWSPTMQALLNQTLERFLASFATSPDRYKAASATQLPFVDNTFDVVFSLDTVTAFFDVDRALLMRAMRECIRVAKPGGVLKFTPFQDEQPSWPPSVNELRFQNDMHLLRWLKENPNLKGIIVTETPAQFHKLLTFRKKAA